MSTDLVRPCALRLAGVPDVTAAVIPPPAHEPRSQPAPALVFALALEHQRCVDLWGGPARCPPRLFLDGGRLFELRTGRRWGRIWYGLREVIGRQRPILVAQEFVPADCER